MVGFIWMTPWNWLLETMWQRFVSPWLSARGNLTQTIRTQYLHPAFQTLMHELGHNLGLDHSNVNGAVMSAIHPWRSPGFVLKLQPDDVRRIQAMYGGATGTGGVQTLPPGQPTGGQVKNPARCEQTLSYVITDYATTIDTMDLFSYKKATISDNTYSV